MPRELLILRHAKSAWGTAATTDFDRPLTGRGKRDAHAIGAWLRQDGLVPDRLVSSPARRARQTITRVSKELKMPKERIAWDPAIYEATLDRLLTVIGRCPADTTRVLLTGHNPGLEHLLDFLSGTESPPSEDGNRLKTATLARLEMPGDWTQLAPGCARLISITHPDLLQGVAPQ